MAPLPDPLPIATRGPLAARVRVPGSKSLTNRALLVAALARGRSRLSGTLASDDTVAMQRALAQLGVSIAAQGDALQVDGRDGRLASPAAPLDAAGSGTTARFLCAAAALADGPVVIDGNARMRERPIADLVDALTALGVRCEILGRAGCPPLRITGGRLPGGRARIDARRSSQYVSAVLLAAPYAQRDVELVAEAGQVVSRPYVDLTLAVMRDFGARAEWSARDTLRVTAGRGYVARDYAIEADASAAAYPFCAAAIAGGRVRVEGVAPGSLQSDFRLLDVLARMGCRVRRGDDFAEVEGPGDELAAVDVDMNDLPDAALALAVVALFAKGTTHIRNVANLRIKESDRLAALEAELRRLGADARADADSLAITPRPLRGAEIHTYDDHRMAMAFALAGLRVPGVAIRDPGCVAKTWPGYFTMLESLQAA